jgi:hypothetical protein
MANEEWFAAAKRTDGQGWSKCFVHVAEQKTAESDPPPYFLRHPIKKVPAASITRQIDTPKITISPGRANRDSRPAMTVNVAATNIGAQPDPASRCEILRRMRVL